MELAALRSEQLVWHCDAGAPGMSGKITSTKGYYEVSLGSALASLAQQPCSELRSKNLAMLEIKALQVLTYVAH